MVQAGSRRAAATSGAAWRGSMCWNAPLSASLAFYGPHALRVQAVPLLPGAHGGAPAQSGSSADDGAAQPPEEEPLGQETVLQRGGLRIAKEVLAQHDKLACLRDLRDAQQS